ncbi:MAG: transcription elongation factor GreA [Candidatus Vogelbacteria bacterium]|nr:transcription elongation factor GreA [Candidatus Vogelbacteria bacterium]
MESDKHYLSQEKFNALKQELDILKTDKRREIAGRLEFAKSMGDLSENAEYQTAREEQADVEERINELESILKVSEIIADRHSSSIGIGSTLVVRKEGSNEENKYRVVGPEEVNPATGQISYLSPLGASLLNKKKGDKVTIKTPAGGEIAYRVVKVS